MTHTKPPTASKRYAFAFVTFHTLGTLAAIEKMEVVKIIEALKTALETSDELMTEDALSLVHSFGIQSDFVPQLIDLIESDWHYRHEDIARLLQDAKDNRATSALHRIASRKFEYLNYDNSYALARKCTWALADIGTLESKNALVDLANSNDETIAGYAQRRIDKWDVELKRKTAANTRS